MIDVGIGQTDMTPVEPVWLAGRLSRIQRCAASGPHLLNGNPGSHLHRRTRSCASARDCRLYRCAPA